MSAKPYHAKLAEITKAHGPVAAALFASSPFNAHQLMRESQATERERERKVAAVRPKLLEDKPELRHAESLRGVARNIYEEQSGLGLTIRAQREAFERELADAERLIDAADDPEPPEAA